METQEPWVCMSDIATYLGVTSETVRNWIKQRDLPGKKMGGRWKFRMSEVEEWAENVRPPTRRNPKPEQLEAYAPSLIMGDCLEQMGLIEDGSVDLILTDPPYNLGLFMQNREAGIMRMRDNYFGTAGWDNLEYDQWVAYMSQMLDESARVLRRGGAMIVFMAVIKIESIVRLAQEHGFYYKTTGTWHKFTDAAQHESSLHQLNRVMDISHPRRPHRHVQQRRQGDARFRRDVYRAEERTHLWQASYAEASRPYGAFRKDAH